MTETAVRTIGPGAAPTDAPRPVRTADRRRVRPLALEVLGGGGFQGASAERKALKEWVVGSGSADADSLNDLPTLRARSRDLERNQPLAGGAIHTVVTNVVGTGLAPQPQLDREILGMSVEDAEAWKVQIEALWWACCDSFDLTRAQDFAGLQDLVMRSALASGDCFTVRRHLVRPGDVIGLKLQVIEADRVANPDGRMDASRLRAGVELDEHGAPVAYHVASRHPGDWMFWEPTKWSRVPSFGARGERLALHHFRRVRPGQTRGIPYLAPVIEPLKQLGRYSEAEIMAAVLSAMFTVFVKTTDADAEHGLAPIANEDGTPGEGSESEFQLGSGSILDLQPNESIEIAQMNRPNVAFDPFVLAILRQVGVGLELPFEVVVKHFTSSYSAARAALLDAWKFYRGRRSWLAWSFCQPVWGWFVTEAVARGHIEAPGYFDNPLVRRAYQTCLWIGDSPGQIDPLKEAQASDLLMKASISTLEEETARLTGGDWRRNIEQRRREVQLLREAGLDREPAAERVIVEKPADADTPDAENEE